MGDAIDWLREEWPWSDVEPSDSECIGIGITPADLARAIDEYDAAAATAGRLMAENAELRARLRQYEETITWHACCPAQAQATADSFDAYQREQMLRDLVAETAAACAVWRRRAEAAEAETLALRLKVSRLESPRATEAEAKAQQARSLAGVTRKPHPEDEADCAEGLRQAEAGEGVSEDEALMYLDVLENAEQRERDLLSYLGDAADVTDEEREDIKAKWGFSERAKEAASKIGPMPESLKAVEAKHAGEQDVSGRDDDPFFSRWRLP